MDTFSNDEGIKWEINKGTPIIISFAGMASRLNELEHFEFVQTTKHANCSKIYCLDKKYIWYQQGINEENNSIYKLKDRLEAIIKESEPCHVRCLGVSAGGFAAILFGYLLNADVVHSFGAQTFLDSALKEKYRVAGMEEYDDTSHHVRDLLTDWDENPDYVFDLKKFLEKGNGKTQFNLHIGSGSKKDVIYARHLETCPGVVIRYYDCDTHACASQLLRRNGKLAEVVLEGL